MTDKQETRKIPCQVWSRIVGYLRPISDWNQAKKDEFRDRVTYDVVEELNHTARD